LAKTTSPVVPPVAQAGAETGSSPRDRRGRSRWLVFIATIFWAASATLARVVFRDHHVPPLSVVELRLLIATTAMFVVLRLRQPRLLRIAARDLPYFVTLGLFGVAAVQGGYYYSISRLGVGLAILLQYLAPSLIVAFDLLRGRHVRPAMLAAVLCALAGTACLVGGIDPRALHASALDWAVGFGCAVSFAFYIVYSKRGLARYAPETVLFYTFALAGLFWAVVTPPWRIVAAGYSPKLWAAFVTLGLFSTLVPFRLFYAGLAHLPSSEAGIIATAEPLVAILAAALFLHERLGPIQLLGALLVIGAALLAARQTPGATEAAAERA